MIYRNVPTRIILYKITITQNIIVFYNLKLLLITILVSVLQCLRD